MAIYTNSKDGLGGQFPAGALDTSWNRTEPLLTPDQLVSRHLFGIPLVSGTKNPFTAKADVINDDMLSDYIDRAVSEVEALTHTEIMPVQIVEKQPYDPQEFKSQGYIRLLRRPASSVESIQIVTSDATPIFSFDLAWIETSHLYQGQINVLPFLLMLRNAGSTGFTGIAGSAAGNSYLSLFGGTRWVPALIQVTYTVGWKDGLVPKVLNDLIGTVVAMQVLSMLAPTFGRSSGASLSIGGMSQSVSNPGPEVFMRRMAELVEKRDTLVKKIKALTGQVLFSGNV